jgi:NADPH:quinone reductase-like Zn-dependent oxidoreductase
MKAIQITGDWGIDQLEMRDVAEVAPGPGEVRIRVHACSLNFRDLRVTQGLYNPKLRRPLTICSDCAGEVVEVASGVTRAKVGDRVSVPFMPAWIAGAPTEAGARSALGAFAQGVLAEQVVQHESAVVQLPAHLSYEEAATLPCAAVTAWHGLVVRCRLKAGDTVVTQGSGGVSVFAIQLAKMFGARVIATSSSAAKLERLRELGATHTINYKETPDWDEAVRQITGTGADMIVDVVGSTELARSIKAAKVGGSVVTLGLVSGGADANLLPAFMKNLTIHGLFVGSREMFEQMNQAIAVNQMRPVIDRVFAFDQTKEALQHLEAGAHFGKVVIRVG